MIGVEAGGLEVKLEPPGLFEGHPLEVGPAGDGEVLLHQRAGVGDAAQVRDAASRNTAATLTVRRQHLRLDLGHAVGQHEMSVDAGTLELDHGQAGGHLRDADF
jgi:hypothetical protein